MVLGGSMGLAAACGNGGGRRVARMGEPAVGCVYVADCSIMTSCGDAGHLTPLFCAGGRIGVCGVLGMAQPYGRVSF